MGQKVSPKGLRIGINKNWDSSWYADSKDVPALIKEDHDIREYLNKVYKDAEVSLVEIERLKAKSKDRLKLTIFTARPGMVIGRDAEIKNKTVSTLEYMTKKEVILNVVEVVRPEMDAQLIANSIARQLERRASFRRVQKIAIQRALRSGAQGVKTLVSGRLGGAEIARAEGYSEGRVSLHTLRADIDYATAEALTTYGILGVKVWVYKGEILGKELRSRTEPKRKPAPRQQRPRGGKRRNVDAKKN